MYAAGNWKLLKGEILWKWEGLDNTDIMKQNLPMLLNDRLEYKGVFLSITAMSTSIVWGSKAKDWSNELLPQKANEKGFDLAFICQVY